MTTGQRGHFERPLPGDLLGELAAESHPLDGWWREPYVVEDEPEDDADGES